MCGSLQLGTATIAGLVLKPGNNTVPLTGKVDIQAVINNLEQVLLLQEPGLEKGALIFNSTMNSTTYNGIHLTNFEKAFNGLVLTASVSCGSCLTMKYANPIQLPILEVVGDSIKGFIKGNTSLAGVTQELMQFMNISDITSMLKPFEKDAESLLGELTNKKRASTLLNEVANDLGAYGG
jgi:hypothetical protein